MNKTLEDYVKNYVENYAKTAYLEARSEERLNAIRTLIQKGFTRDVILSLNYSEAELEAAEKSLLAQV